MTATLVIQSHRDPLPFEWLQSCTDSVAAWAGANQFQYRFIGDEIFDLVEPELAEGPAEDLHAQAPHQARHRLIPAELVGSGRAEVGSSVSATAAVPRGPPPLT